MTRTLMTSLAAALALGGCTATPDEAVAPVDSISGELRALFSVLTSEVTPDLWELYGSDIAVFALTDPDDLSSAVGSTTLDAPGDFTIDFAPTDAPLWLVAVLEDGDGVLSSTDQLWEYSGNPIVGGATDAAMDVDLALMAGDDEDDEPIAFTLRGVWESTVPARLIVTTSWNDMTVTLGSQDVSPGDAIAIDLPDGPVLDVIAINDTNEDGLYGATDLGGLVTSFPPPSSDSLDLGPVVLPEGVAAPAVQPNPWVAVTGTVSGDDEPVLIEARRFTATGRLWSRLELDEPGPFALRVPRSSTAGTSGRDQDRQLWLHAFVDADGDATLDLQDEDQAGAGPFTVEEGGLDLALQLGPPGPRIWGGITGTIEWDGTAAGEHVVVAVFLEDATWEGLCEYVRVYSDPVFPLTYSFPNLPSGRYQTGAMLTLPEVIVDPMEATALGMRDEVLVLEAGVDLQADFDLVTGAVPPVDNGGG